MSNNGCFGFQQTKSDTTPSNYSSKSSSSRETPRIQKTPETLSQSLKITHINKQNIGQVKLLKPQQGTSAANNNNNIYLLNSTSSKNQNNNKFSTSNDNKTNQNIENLKNIPRFVQSSYEAPRKEEKNTIPSTDQKQESAHDFPPHSSFHQNLSQKTSDNKLGCTCNSNHANTQQSELIKSQNFMQQICIPRQYDDNFSWLNSIPLYCSKHPTQFIIHPEPLMSQNRQHQQQQQPQTIIYINSVSINSRSRSKDDSSCTKEIPMSKCSILSNQTAQTVDSLSTLQTQCYHHKTDNNCGHSGFLSQRNLPSRQQQIYQNNYKDQQYLSTSKPVDSSPGNQYTDSENSNTKSMLCSNLRQSQNHSNIQPTSQSERQRLMIKPVKQGQQYLNQNVEFSAEHNHQRLTAQLSNKGFKNLKLSQESSQSQQKSSKQCAQGQPTQPIQLSFQTGSNKVACPLMPKNQNTIQQTLKISNPNHKNPNLPADSKFSETCVDSLETKDHLQYSNSMTNHIESVSQNTAQFIDIPDQFKVSFKKTLSYCENENKPSCSPSFRALSEQQSEQKDMKDNQKDIPKLSFLESSCSFACQEDSKDGKIEEIANNDNLREDKNTYSMKNSKDNSVKVDSQRIFKKPNLLNYPQAFDKCNATEGQVTSGREGVPEESLKQQVKETYYQFEGNNQQQQKEQITSWLVTETKHFQQKNQVDAQLLGNNNLLRSIQTNQKSEKDQLFQPAQRMKPQIEENPSKLLFTRTSMFQTTSLPKTESIRQWKEDQLPMK